MTRSQFLRLHVHEVAKIRADGVPLAGPLPGMEPDEALTVNYKAFPHVFVPPYHYANPVTGQQFRKR